jgi:hypothetical protein
MCRQTSILLSNLALLQRSAATAPMLEYRPTKIFFFFGGAIFGKFRPTRGLQVVSWLVIGTSPWGQNCLNFAPGVGQNSLPVGRYSWGTSNFRPSAQPPHNFEHLRVLIALEKT